MITNNHMLYRLRDLIAGAVNHNVESARSRRVVILLGGIVVLSVLDLVMTLAYLLTIGMQEANPIAAMVIESTNSALSLTCFKLLTLLIAGWCIFRIRTHTSGEAAAWVCLAILVALSIQWHFYAAHYAEPESLTMVVAGTYDEYWLRLD